MRYEIRTQIAIDAPPARVWDVIADFPQYAPTALGVNPLLTISALAERNCHAIATITNGAPR